MNSSNNISLKKQFSAKLVIVILIAFVLSVLASYIFQTEISQKTEVESALLDINNLTSSIDANNKAIDDLTANLNEESIAKAKAFRIMIELNPSILVQDPTFMQQIADELDVDEVHVTDENGVLQWGNIVGFYGFDFASGEQTIPFLPALENPSFEMAQEPQLNGASGVLFQYTSIARRDKKGIIQVGLAPTRLEKALKNNKIELLAENFYSSEGRKLIIVDNDGKILYSPDSTAIEQNYDTYGITGEIFDGTSNGEFLKLNGEKLYAYSQKTDDYTIITTHTPAEMYENRNTQLIITTIILLFLSIVILIVVNLSLDKNVIHEINSLNSTLNEIRNGNLNVYAKSDRNIEFVSLSDGINSMVESIKDKISDSENMISSQKGILASVLDVSTSIQDEAQRLSDSSDDMNLGSRSQSDIVSRLTDINKSLKIKLDNTVKSTEKAVKESKKVDAVIKDGNEHMEELSDSMDKILSLSEEISKINQTVESIAMQTNILALNASVEAARAGAAGKGFSVVAEEVRNLATKSDIASKDTTALIEKTLLAVNQGKERTARASEILGEIIEIVECSTELIEKVSEDTHSQFSDIDAFSDGFDEFLTSVRTFENATQNATMISSDLYGNAKSLLELSEN